MVDGRAPARFGRGLPLFLLLFLAMTAGRPVAGGDERREPVARHVIALFDGDAGHQDLDVEDPVHQLLELPLHHLGMVVVRHDVRRGPPPRETLTDLRAVITFFDHTEEPVGWLMSWLEERRREGGIRFLHLGELGPLRFPVQSGESGRLARWFAGFGLGFDSYFAEQPLGVEVKLRDPLLCAFEADPRGHSIHHGPWIESGANIPWITTECPTDPGHTRTPVVTGPWGGIALNPWLYREGPGDGTRRWHIDPFAFLTAALGLEGVPAPCPVVLNGRRMFFCHVDGDGFESLSTVRRGARCGEVFLAEILEKYRLPFSVSVIVSSLADRLDPEEPTALMRLAARVLAHPRVEPASHAVTHPLLWGRMETGMKPTFAFPELPGFARTLPGEVRESVRFIERYLLPPGKRCGLMLWTGNCCPEEDAIAEAERLGLLHLNGGTYRYDALYDSLAYVQPWGRIVGGHVQVYCGAPNEVVYDGYFETHPGAFGHVDETIERTGRGRILKPANVYVHFFSVERPGRLRVFRQLLDRWALREPTAPVFASTWVRAVRSALLTARIHRTPEGWAFRDFGDCYTARIDGETRHVDWDGSPGILGACRRDGSLYLHLSRPDADVALVARPVPRPHVKEADHLLTEATRSPTGVAVTSESLAPRRIVFAGFPPGSTVRLRLDGAVRETVADERGEVPVVLEEPGRNRVEVMRP